MYNPFIDVPLNTKQSYVMGTTHSGCEVYLPVDSDDDDILNSAKDNLKEWLLTQPKPTNEPTPPALQCA